MTKFRMLPSVERLRQCLHYNPETGLFVKIERVKGFNQFAGCKRSRRRGDRWLILICVDNVQYPAHRIAWCYQAGDDPGMLTVDHINRDPWDNRFANLRLADYTQQAVNRGNYRNSVSRYRGVGWHKATGKWQARVGLRGTRINLGLFDTEELAHEARVQYLTKNPDPTIIWRVDE